MALNSHSKQNTWDSICFTYFQVWGKSIARLKYEVVVVAAGSLLQNASVQFGIPPSPQLFLGCAQGASSLDSGGECLQTSSEFSVSAFMFLLCICLSFLVFQKQSIPLHRQTKTERPDLHPSQHFMLILWEHSSSYLQPHQGPSELGSSSILSIYFSERSIVSRCHFPCSATTDQGHEW